MSETSSYDLVVIGSGPAGHRAAIAAAKLRKTVAVIERKQVVGGVCVNTGTIPSKTLRDAILYLSGYRYRDVYGYDYRVKQDITMADLMFRANHVIRHELGVLRNQFQRNGVDLIQGEARFVEPHTIHCESFDGTHEVRGEQIIIASGTRPARPDDVPFDDRLVHDSETLLCMESIPRSMIVVGGGVIGLEYACMFSTLGTPVTLVEARPTLLDFVDRQIVETLKYHMRERGVTLRLAEKVTAIQRVERNGQTAVEARLDSGKKTRAGVLLYAVGRQGTGLDLNLSAAGLECDARGRIAVDDSYRTTVPHIRAVGDIIGFPALASTSMEQGRLAAGAAFGHPMEARPAFYPYGIYTVPEISTVGRNEEQLTADRVPYETGLAYFREIAKGNILGDETGLLKLLVHTETRCVLGVHVIGDQAAELVHIGQAVMALGGTVDYLRDCVFNYPTLAECYKVAALDAANKLDDLGD